MIRTTRTKRSQEVPNDGLGAFIALILEFVGCGSDVFSILFMFC